MTNIVEIIALLNKEGYHIDVAIIDAKLYICYQADAYDITTMRFTDQIRLIAHLLNKEIFG